MSFKIRTPDHIKDEIVALKQAMPELSGRELARACGVSDWTISQILRAAGIATPGRSYWLKKCGRAVLQGSASAIAIVVASRQGAAKARVVASAVAVGQACEARAVAPQAIAGRPSALNPPLAAEKIAEIVEAKRQNPALGLVQAHRQLGVTRSCIKKYWQRAGVYTEPVKQVKKECKPPAPARRGIPSEKIDAIVALAKAEPGLSCREMCRRLQVCYKVINRALEDAGLPVPGPRVHPRADEIVAAKRDDPTLSIGAAARTFAASPDTVKRLWKKHGLPSLRLPSRVDQVRDALLDAKRANPLLSQTKAALIFKVRTKDISAIWAEAGLDLSQVEIARMRKEAQPPKPLKTEPKPKQPPLNTTTEATKEQIRAAKRDRPELSGQAIARLLGVGKNTARRVLREAGLLPPLPKKDQPIEAPKVAEPSKPKILAKSASFPSKAAELAERRKPKPEDNDPPRPQDGIRISVTDDPLGPELKRVYGSWRPSEMPPANLNREADVLQRINLRRGFRQIQILRQKGSGYAA